MKLPRMISGAAVTMAIVAATAATVPADASAGERGRWAGTWAAAVQPPVPGDDFSGPNWSMEGFADQTLRQVVRVSGGGSTVRIRLSNLYGTRALKVTGATVGKTGDGAAVRPGTIRPLTFGRSLSTTIPAGRGAASDAVRLPVAPLDSLTVTLYLAGSTGPATFHQAGQTTSYRAAGDHRSDTGAAAFSGETSHSFYYLTGVDVSGPTRQTVVAYGDSITDGHGSTPGAANRYPDQLAERLTAAGRRLGVSNAGINGNLLLNDVLPCFGERGLTRFRRDVLAQPGVRTVILLEGTNDIFASETDIGCGTTPRITAAELIEGYRTLIKSAHARGVRVVGATIPPFKSDYLPQEMFERAEGIRDAVNTWIRTSAEFDSVADFAAALADTTDTDRLNPAYDSGDGIHPNDAGYEAMAQAIGLNTL